VSSEDLVASITGATDNVVTRRTGRLSAEADSNKDTLARTEGEAK